MENGRRYGFIVHSARPGSRPIAYIYLLPAGIKRWATNNICMYVIVSGIKEAANWCSILTRVPADDLAFESYEAGYVWSTSLYVILILNTLSHLLALVLDSERENPLFRSPVGKNPTHILDIGTGKGTWAMYVRRESPACPVPDRTYTNITLI